MTIRLPSRRLRLFFLSLSLFCCGIATAQTTPPPAGPPGVSVLGYHWDKHVSYGMTSNRETPTPVGEVNETVPPAPTWPASGTTYWYYIEIKNEGPKVIRSTALDYVFTDPDSKAELARRGLFSFEKIDLNKKKWLEVRSRRSGPPRIATVEGLKKDRSSPFDEHVEIKCVLYTDGTGWKAPNAEKKTCDNLVTLTLHAHGR